MNDMVEKIRQWMLDRPTLMEANAQPHTMLKLLRQEIDELEQAILHEPTENQHKEWLDSVWFLLSMAIIWHIDIDAVFFAKLERNSRKYDASLFQDGSYAEAVAKIKAEWTED